MNVGTLGSISSRVIEEPGRREHAAELSTGEQQ